MFCLFVQGGFVGFFLTFMYIYMHICVCIGEIALSILNERQDTKLQLPVAHLPLAPATETYNFGTGQSELWFC